MVWLNTSANKNAPGNDHSFVIVDEYDKDNNKRLPRMKPRATAPAPSTKGIISQPVRRRNRKQGHEIHKGEELRLDRTQYSEGTLVPDSERDNTHQDSDESKYDFTEHPRPEEIDRCHQKAASIWGPKEPLKVQFSVMVHFDNCADSNFISSTTVASYKFKKKAFEIRGYCRVWGYRWDGV